jgi:poly(hydroxyalkanoate) granule-associated protein
MAIKTKTTLTFGFKESANEIWLAGLGALNFVGAEGTRLFQELVEKGRGVEEEHEDGWLSGITERATELKEDAKNALSMVTTPIEDGLSATMQRLGMPSREEIAKLTHRVEELTRSVQQAKARVKVETEDETEEEVKPKAKANPKAKAKPKVAVRTKGKKVEVTAETTV